MHETGQDDIGRLRAHMLASAAFASVVFALFAAETILMATGIRVYGGGLPVYLWWGVHIALFASACGYIVFAYSRISRALRKASLPAADKAVICSICSGMIKIGLPIVRCACGKSYHSSCAERLGECPKCGGGIKP